MSSKIKRTIQADDPLGLNKLNEQPKRVKTELIPHNVNDPLGLEKSSNKSMVNSLLQKVIIV